MHLITSFTCVFSPSRQIGEIASVLSLEDWGPIGTQQIVVAAAQDSSNVSTLINSKMSLVVRKPAFCICKNKDADQRLCFRYTDSTIPLLPKTDISSL